MKSKTMERFMDGLFYIKCESSNKNLEIRNLCKEYGLNVFENWGIYRQNTEHVLSYKLIASEKCKGLITSRRDINTKMLAEDFIRKVKQEMNNEFKKSDLVLGKHVVRFRDGDIMIYLGNGFIDGDGVGKIHINNFNNDLTFDNHERDIMEIFEIKKIERMTALDLSKLLLEENLTSIWKREEQTEAEKQLEAAQKLLQEAQEAVRKAQEEIERG